jgi:hypothetical protein
MVKLADLELRACLELDKRMQNGLGYLNRRRSGPKVLLQLIFALQHHHDLPGNLEQGIVLPAQAADPGRQMVPPVGPGLLRDLLDDRHTADNVVMDGFNSRVAMRCLAAGVPRIRVLLARAMKDSSSPIAQVVFTVMTTSVALIMPSRNPVRPGSAWGSTHQAHAPGGTSRPLLLQLGPAGR